MDPVVRPRHVLITGASKGIGRAAALDFDRHGWHVLAAVRRDADAEALRRDASPRLGTLRLDITEPDDIARAADVVDRTTGGRGLDALVNNAGIAVAGPLEFLPIDALRRQLEVNLIGQIAVTQAMLPGIRRAAGRIIFISSVAGRSAMPFTGAYAASKFALEAAADALRVELAEWSIRVVLIEPGVIETPIWDTSLEAANAMVAQAPAELIEYYGRVLEGLRRRVAAGVRGRAAADVARVIRTAAEARRPAARYSVGLGPRARTLLERLPTRLRDHIVAAGVRRL
jgi:NAD(P)-dependent dehydrogenase (short-subunit alcohol dehydrogenase family)